MANGKIDPPIWYNVNADARIWSGHSANAQKQGWLRAPAAILAVDEYKGSFQFKDWKIVEGLGGKDEIVIKGGYPDLFIRIEDTSLSQYVDPDDSLVPVPDEGPVGPTSPPPTEIGDAELGAAVRVVVTKVASLVAPYFNSTTDAI